MYSIFVRMVGQVKGWKPRNRGSTPRSKTFSLLQSVVTCSGFHPATYSKGNESELNPNGVQWGKVMNFWVK